MLDNSRLHALEPDAYGYWGEATVVANQAEISFGIATVPIITFLEYEFEGWLGDDLLSGHACFIVTETLARDLQDAGITGVEFADVLISKSLNFAIVSPGVVLPPFERIIPLGTVDFVAKNAVSNWSGHDVCFANYPHKMVNEMGFTVPPVYQLVVTDRCLRVLQEHNIKHCKVVPLTHIGPEA